MSVPVVAFLPASDDGCAFYRMWMPHLHVDGSRYMSQVPIPHQALEGSKVIMVQRLVTKMNYDSLRKMKDFGMKLVYDLDDDLWAVQAANPAKKLLERVIAEELGFRECAKICDLVTVSTSRLLTSVEKNHLNIPCPVKVINNAVDLMLFQPCILPKNPDKVIFGWSGSTTHAEDLSMMGESMLELTNKEPKANLHFVGMLPSIKYVQKPRVLSHGWVPVKEYPVRLATWNWDVALAPLHDNRFNRSKSNIKMQEAGALGIPCLASPVQPYLEFVSHDKDLEWLICKSPKDWLSKARELTNNEEMRSEFGAKMRKVTLAIYNMEARGKVWSDTFAGLAS